MKIRARYLPLSEAGPNDVTVVIDVLRACTSAAWMLHVGAEHLIAVDSVEQAHAIRRRLHAALLAGEVGGRRPAGFDLGNSPSEISKADLTGRTIVHRTSAGTQGLARAASSTYLFAASFVTATATARALRTLRQRDVDFVITGASLGRDGDEDLAAAEYIVALANGQTPASEPFLSRVAQSDAGQAFTADGPTWAPAADLALACQIDRFDFALTASTDSQIRAVRLKRSNGGAQDQT